MSQLQKIIIVAAIAAFSLSATPAAHAGPFDKLIGGAAKKVVGGVGKSVNKNVIRRSKYLVRKTPSAFLKSLRPRRK